MLGKVLISRLDIEVNELSSVMSGFDKPLHDQILLLPRP